MKTKNSKGELISRKFKGRLILMLWAGVILPVLMIVLVLVFISESSLPSIDELENPRSNEASIVYSSDGKQIGSFYLSNRTKVNYNDLSPHLIDALVATEDVRFYTHSGVDVKALLRAVFGVFVGKNKGGASTITQQLSKMMFHERPKSKLKRVIQKFAEWIIASRLEKRYTKQEIIAMYFNEFDFLNTAVGIHSAARIYFNKSPKELSIEQSAMLVGMAKNPSIFNPVRRPEKTLKRREVVLFQMKNNSILTQQQYDSIRQLPLGLDYHPETHTTGLAPYFREHVRIKTKQIVKNNNLLNEYRKPINIYSDGLKIYTSIDANVQKHAEKAVAKHLQNTLQNLLNKEIKNNKHWPFSNETSKTTRKNSINRAIKNSERYRKLVNQGWSKEDIMKNFNTKQSIRVFDWKSKGLVKQKNMTPKDSILYYKSILRAGLIAIDPHTGFVKAWVGGINYRHFKYDCSNKSKRQVGSTMKPFVYAAAIESGQISPCTTFPDIKYCIDIPFGGITKQWCPGGQKNYSGEEIPVYYALASSKNNITAQVIKLTGGKNSRVVNYFKTMGLWNKSIEKVSSLGLGVCDLSVLEQTSAHCIFSNYGVYVQPITVVRIEDKYGNLLWEPKQEIKQVIDPNTAFSVLKMMKGVTGVKNPITGKTGGTARRLKSTRAYSFSGIMAGKTGTTQNNSDGWFVGHTPDLVAGVWVGAEDPSVHFKTTVNGQGANTALPIWGYFMKEVYRDNRIKINKTDFIPPNEGDKTQIECTYSTNNTDNPWM
ncbi:MAG: penicillin-binding protein [Crocinitomicaceae bacterium]|nr:penicillin-binding protein [Crocinitomicaceae bacterium]